MVMMMYMQDELSTGFTKKVIAVLKDKGGPETDKWNSIRSLVKSENEKVKLAAVGVFGTKNEQIVTDLETHARDIVVNIVKDESDKVEELMKERLINSMHKL